MMSFKPCFKWLLLKIESKIETSPLQESFTEGFKPCFKWLLLKIYKDPYTYMADLEPIQVLNLVLNGYSLK